MSLHSSQGNANIHTLLYVEPDLHLHPQQRAKQDTAAEGGEQGYLQLSK